MLNAGVLFKSKNQTKRKINNLTKRYMKKSVLGLAIAAMSFTAFSTMAQTTACNNTASCNNEQVCTANTACTKVDAVCTGGECALFDGLNLTDTQKAQLQKLNADRKASREQLAKARKESKMRTDSAARADRRASKKQYLEEVKAIIGPDQYVTFLENVYINGVNGQRPGNKAAFAKENRGKAHAMRPGKGDRKLRRDGKVQGKMVKTSLNQAKTQSN